MGRSIIKHNLTKNGGLGAACEEPDNPQPMEEFADIADEILEAADEGDYEHIWPKLQCILRDNGMIPGGAPAGELII